CFEALEPLAHVGVKSKLGLLAVSQDVDPREGLLAYALGHRAAHPLLVGVAVVRRTGNLRFHQVEHVPRPRQAPHMRRQDAIGTSVDAHSGSYSLCELSAVIPMQSAAPRGWSHTRYPRRTAAQ